MNFHLLSRLIFSFLLLFLWTCSEIDRDNVLDPKNTSSKSESVILLEAFINTNRAAPAYNFLALQAIDSLKEIYQNRLIVCEYHRNTSNPAYDDPLVFDNIIIENFYEEYTVNYSFDRFKGVPDLFLNGAAHRVQGVSTLTNVIDRLQDFSNDLIINEGEYTIETETVRVFNDLSCVARIARLGNQDAPEMILKVVLTYNGGLSGKHTVSNVSVPVPIGEIKAGEYEPYDILIREVDWEKAENAVFVLYDNTAINVLHAVNVSLSELR